MAQDSSISSFMDDPYVQSFNDFKQSLGSDDRIESFIDPTTGRKGYRPVGAQPGPTVVAPDQPTRPSFHTTDPFNFNLNSGTQAPSSTAVPDIGPAAGIISGALGALGIGATLAKASKTGKDGTSTLGNITGFVKKQFNSLTGDDDNKLTLPSVADDAAGLSTNAAAATNSTDNSITSEPLAPFMDSGSSSPPDITGNEPVPSADVDSSSDSPPDITGNVPSIDTGDIPPAQDFGNEPSLGSDEPGMISGGSGDDNLLGGGGGDTLSGGDGITFSDVGTAANYAASAYGVGTNLANGDYLGAAKSLPYVGPFVGLGDDLFSGDMGDAAVDTVEIAAMSNPYTAAALGIAKGVEAIVDGVSVICTELHDQGIMPDYMYKADGRYGQFLRIVDPAVIVGYHFWAKPIVRLMRKYPLVTKLMAKIALPWGEEMAYQMGARDKGNILGKVLIFVGYPICRFIGKVKGS